MKNTGLNHAPSHLGKELLFIWWKNGTSLGNLQEPLLILLLSHPLWLQELLQDEVYLSWILPLVLQQLLQVNLEGEPALSQVSAQLGHTQQVRLGA